MWRSLLENKTRNHSIQTKKKNVTGKILRPTKVEVCYCLHSKCIKAVGLGGERVSGWQKEVLVSMECCGMQQDLSMAFSLAST